MTKLELDLLKLSEGKSLEFAAYYAAIIPQIIEVLKTQNTPESFEQAHSEIFSPIVKRPYPRLENGDYKYIEIDQGWKLWQAATAQAVPEWNDYTVKGPRIDGRYQIFINGEQIAADWKSPFGFACPIDGCAFVQELITHWAVQNADPVIEAQEQSHD